VKILCALGLNLFSFAIYNRKCAYPNCHLQLLSAQWSLFRLWELKNEKMDAFFNTIALWPMPVRQSVRNL
jgi:hypothetical protein